MTLENNDMQDKRNELPLKIRPYYSKSRVSRITKHAAVLALFLFTSPSLRLPPVLQKHANSIQEGIKSLTRQFPNLLDRDPLLVAFYILSGSYLAHLSITSFLDYVLQKNLLDKIRSNILSTAMSLSSRVSKLVEDETSKALLSVESHLIVPDPSKQSFSTLPIEGLESSRLLDIVSARVSRDMDIKNSGKLSGAVYVNDKDLDEFLVSIAGKFISSNPLHPELFPTTREMEAEIIRMVLNLFNGGEHSAGSLTTGGTESILMAVKAWRDFGKEIKGITEPELICCDSAHAAFIKACQYFRIKPVLIPCDSKGEINLKKVKRAITENTILIVGSCPSFPHGVFDDIETLSKLALDNQIPLHVDGCLGSLFLPFVKNTKFSLPYEFDFTLPGVSSISCDLHKYGFAPKGVSIIMYRHREYQYHQMFTLPNWMGGIYASPTMTGSRSGLNIALCWATLMKIGQRKYIEQCELCLEAAKAIQAGFERDPLLRDHLVPVAESHFTIVAFKMSDKNGAQYTSNLIYPIVDILGERFGWKLNSLAYPPAFHLCITANHLYRSTPEEVANTFIQNLHDSLQQVLENIPEYSQKSDLSLYGTAAKIPQSLVTLLAKRYYDVVYQVPKQ